MARKRHTAPSRKPRPPLRAGLRAGDLARSGSGEGTGGADRDLRARGRKPGAEPTTRRRLPGPHALCDIARADERGYLFILDRKKDMIVSGGFNIYPREVEGVLSAHVDFAMVAVIGVAVAEWGGAVTAMIVPRAGARPNPDELIALVKARKGPAHAPKHIEVVDSLPTTAVGKVDKKALRAKFWAGQKRMVG